MNTKFRSAKSSPMARCSPPAQYASRRFWMPGLPRHRVDRWRNKSTLEQIRIGANFEQVIRNFRLLQARRNRRGDSSPAPRINHVLSEMNYDAFDEFLASGTRSPTRR